MWTVCSTAEECRWSGQATGAPGLYFCGQITSPTGQLREIGLEARRIAEVSKRYIAALSPDLTDSVAAGPVRSMKRGP
jgi:hypothetical protein